MNYYTFIDGERTKHVLKPGAGDRGWQPQTFCGLELQGRVYQEDEPMDPYRGDNCSECQAEIPEVFEGAMTPSEMEDTDEI